MTTLPVLLQPESSLLEGRTTEGFSVNVVFDVREAVCRALSPKCPPRKTAGLVAEVFEAYISVSGSSDVSLSAWRREEDPLGIRVEVAGHRISPTLLEPAPEEVEGEEGRD